MAHTNRIVGLVLLAVLALSVTSARVARADETRTRRYGGKIAAADGLALGAVLLGTGLTFVGFLSEHDCYEDGDGENCDRTLRVGLALGLAGAVSFVVTSPMLHLREGNRRGAAVSLALRGVPLLGLGIAWFENGDLENGGLAVAAISALVIPFVDAIWNARVTVHVAPLPAGGGTVGVGARF